MISDYSYNEIIETYSALGVDSGATVFVESDLACLGVYEKHDREGIVSGHYNALRELVGEEGTIVVPTFTTYLCNQDTAYSPYDSISEMGIFSEYIRKLPDAIRSYHALTSYTAIGKNANFICKNVSRLAYGPESPMDRMISCNARFISIGLKPHDTCSTVHQAELVMGVPYRYIKEFNQHVANRQGRVSVECFYMHVRYKSSNIKKDKRKLFGSFSKRSSVLKSALGRGVVYGYSMKEFYQHSIKCFKENPYAILSSPRRPYTFTI